MNNSLIIVSTILVCTIFIPFIMMNYLGNRDTKKLRRMFTKMVSEQKLTVSVEEAWAGSCIGIDSVNKKLIFLKYADNQVAEQIIDLGLLKDCRILERMKEFRRMDHTESKLESIALVLSFRQEHPDIILYFYDTDSPYQEFYERPRAAKWKKNILDTRMGGNTAQNAA